MKELILKYLDGDATEAELAKIRLWMESPKNKRTFEHYTRIHALINHMDINVDSDKAYKKVLSEINVQPKNSGSKRTAIPLWLKYAAAASFFLILFFVIKKDDIWQQPSVNDTKVSTSIQPGSNKAILVLEDGSTAELEEGKAYRNDNLSSDGNNLVYNEASTTNDKNAETETEIRYNRLRIPRGGQFQITLSDGTHVWINSESEIKYPVHFKTGDSRVVELLYGEVYFDVSPSSDHNGDTFKVLSNNQEIEVLGTEFNIKAYQEETNTYTTLVEGKIGLTAFSESMTLSPNQQAVLNGDQGSLNVSTVDVYNEISWKDGVFSFKSKSLQEIMVVLSRWYDFEIEFKNDKIKKEEFVGVLGKHEKIEDILLNMKQLGVINDFRFDDRILILE